MQPTSSGVKVEDEIAIEQEGRQELNKSFRWWRLALPMVIGLVAVAVLLWGELRRTTFEAVPKGQGDHVWHDANGNGKVDPTDPAEFTPQPRGDRLAVTGLQHMRDMHLVRYGWLLLLCALLANGIRDLGYMARLRILSSGSLNWKQCFEVTMLWEFANAAAPAVVGGTSIAVYVMSREGIGLGRSAALALATVMLDELFFLVLAPLVFFGAGMDRLFPAQLDEAMWGLPMQALFWIGYTFIAVMKLGIFYSVFFRPRAIKLLLVNLFRHKWVRRFRPRIAEAGDDLISASAELKDKPASFWLKAIGATWCSWGARFLVLNFIAAAFFHVSDHLLMYARQLVLWIVLLISPTPGASGAAEFAFTGFMRDLLPVGAMLVIVAILWRLLTYYIYLFAGAVVMPRWLRRTHS